MSTNIFISSTCYDLIDLRAELEVFFRESALNPILSDSALSEFQTHPNENSIQSCLSNVRACDHFVIILSRRYGPRLGNFGFEDISATHLEYKEAVKAKKPIHMYVRDRLAGDLESWRKNGKPPSFGTNWLDSKDFSLFELIEEHTRLSSDARQNWKWDFRNSVELKQRLAIDFKATTGRAILDQLSRSGLLPMLIIEGTARADGNHSAYAELSIKNVGATAAISPTLEIDSAFKDTLPTLSPGEAASYTTKLYLASGTEGRITTKLTYLTLQGHRIADEGELAFSAGSPVKKPVRYSAKTKCYLGSDGIQFLVPDSNS